MPGKRTSLTARMVSTPNDGPANRALYKRTREETYKNKPEDVAGEPWKLIEWPMVMIS